MITPLEVVIGLLASRVECPVVSKVPARRPDLFVRVDQGAPQSYGPTQDKTLIIVQVYGVDQEQVIGLIGQIRRILRFELDHPNIVGFLEDSGPDPDIPAVYRWQTSGDLFTDLT